MDGTPGRRHMRTLGEHLLSLGPGAPCPCCGSSLEVSPEPEAAMTRRSAVLSGPLSGTSAGSDPGRRTGGAVEALLCPECGCEVDEGEGGPNIGGARRALSPAA